MSATVYQWGEAIGLQWHDKGPIVFLGPDGLTTHRYSLPADACILLSTGDSLDSIEDEAYREGYIAAIRDAKTALDDLV